MRYYIIALMSLFPNCVSLNPAASMQQGKKTDYENVLVVNSYFKLDEVQELDAKLYEGSTLSGNGNGTPFKLQIASDRISSTFYWEVDGTTWYLDSKIDELPINIDLSSVALGGIRDGLLVMFSHGDSLEGCNLHVNGVPLSYSVVKLEKSGRYSVAYEQITGSCEYQSVTGENARRHKMKRIH